MKICRTCGKSLPLTSFPKTDGRYFRAHCKPCHRARHQAYVREWRKKNAAKNCESSAAYRARRRSQTIPLTPEQKAQIVEVYERARRLTLLTGVEHHVDHIQPLAHELCCGLHVPWNLQVLPRELNRAKSNKLTLDTLAGRAVL